MIAQPILQGKTAVVTGAGTGIGKATALCLSQAGASVVIAELNSVTGEESAAVIQKQTENPVLFVQTDVSRSESIRAMVQVTIDRFGRLDIAVNNAGMHPTPTARPSTRSMKTTGTGCWRPISPE